jgi:Leu/Phe-tRNA-protein transferase
MTKAQTMEEPLQGKNRSTERKAEKAELEAYIPPYLRRFVTPYHGEFCYTRTYHHRLVAQLMMEGFLPIATEGVILPKLHHDRCVIQLPHNLHISKSIRKKSKNFLFTVNRDFDRVVEACRKQHGSRCWLYPELVEVFRDIHDPEYVEAVIIPTCQGGTALNCQTPVLDRQACPVRLYSIEVWNEKTGELVAGELGYTVGSIFTSLTGFTAHSGAGSVQLAALGRLLCTLGFSMWDLGMDMDYKQSLGAHNIPRKEFVKHVHEVRAAKGHLVLPPSSASFNCRALIDQDVSVETLLASNAGQDKSDASAAKTQTQKSNGFHSPPRQPSSPEPERKKRKN